MPPYEPPATQRRLTLGPAPAGWPFFIPNGPPHSLPHRHHAPGRSRTATGTTTSPASAPLSPNPPATSPTASGPSPPASPAALLSVTATELLPGRLPYSRAWSTGYHGERARQRHAERREH